MTTGAGKGDKSRVRSLRKWQAGYEAINWNALASQTITDAKPINKTKTKRKAKNAKS